MMPASVTMGVVYVVAITHAPAGAGVEAENLAQRLGDGMAALDLRMSLTEPLPRVLLRTPSRERADEVARVLMAAGIDATAVDLADVLPVARMVHMHRFALEEESLHADPGGPVLAYQAIAAIVRVAATTSIRRTTREREPQSGGDDRTEIEVERTRTERAIEHATFLFVRGEGIPWVLRSNKARYLGLGKALRPTVMENYLTVVGLLRARAPQAIYDERFVAHPLVHNAEIHVREHDSAVPELGDPGIEVRVQLLAHTLLHGPCAGPYR
jgi:hypothetical protein